MKRILLLSILTVPHSLHAHEDADLHERIELLEQRVKSLEQHHAAQIPVNESAEVDYGYAMVRYWLGQKSAFPVSAEQPLASGRMKLGQDFLLRPQEYGVTDGDAGLFSRQLDPSRYPVVSLSVDAILKIAAAAEYTLVIKPTPPREVGGSGNVEMAFDIYIGGKKVISQPYSSSLAPKRVQLTLPEGESPFRMELVSRSPGFGPSPTKARLFVAFQAKGSVSQEPIVHFLLSPR